MLRLHLFSRTDLVTDLELRNGLQEWTLTDSADLTDPPLVQVGKPRGVYPPSIYFLFCKSVKSVKSVKRLFASRLGSTDLASVRPAYGSSGLVPRPRNPGPSACSACGTPRVRDLRTPYPRVCPRNCFGCKGPSGESSLANRQANFGRDRS